MQKCQAPGCREYFRVGPGSRPKDVLPAGAGKEREQMRQPCVFGEVPRAPAPEIRSCVTFCRRYRDGEGTAVGQGTRRNRSSGTSAARIRRPRSSYPAQRKARRAIQIVVVFVVMALAVVGCAGHAETGTRGRGRWGRRGPTRPGSEGDENGRRESLPCPRTATTTAPTSRRGRRRRPCWSGILATRTTWTATETACPARTCPRGAARPRMRVHLLVTASVPATAPSTAAGAPSPPSVADALSLLGRLSGRSAGEHGGVLPRRVPALGLGRGELRLERARRLLRRQGRRADPRRPRASGSTTSAT